MTNLRQTLGKLFNSYWPILLLLLLVLVFFWKVVFLNQIALPADFVVGTYYPWLDYKWGYGVGVPVKNPITTDVVSFSYPMRTLAVDLLKKGELPLWNQYILAGVPLLANFQSAPFTLTNIYFFLFDTLAAWNFQVISQHALAAIFMYILLRHWRISKIGSVIGGIIYAFSGFNLIWSQWNAHTLAAAYIPLLIFLVDKFIKAKGNIYGVLISLVIALQILAGYPQIVFYTLIALLLYWFLVTIKIKVNIKKSLLLLIFVLLGIGLTSFQILPARELLSLSQRAIEPHPFEWAFLPLEKIITFIAPDFFGNHATKNYWGPQDYTSNTGFVGVVGLTLSIFAYYLFKKNKKVKYAVLLLVTSLFLSFATPISIFLWKSGFFGFQAASAHRGLILFNLAISILAAFGLEIFLKRRKIKLLPILIPGLLLFGFGLYALLMYVLGNNYPDLYSSFIKGIPAFKVSLRNLIFPLGIFVIITAIYVGKRFLKINEKVIIVAILLITIFELFRFGWKFTPFSPKHIVYPQTPVLNFLTEQEEIFRVYGGRVIPVNMLMPYLIDRLEGYDAVYPYNIAKFVAIVNSANLNADPQGRYATVDNLDSHLLDLTNVKYVLLRKFNDQGKPDELGSIPDSVDTQRYQPVFEDKTVVILENTHVLPRVFMVYQWEVVESQESALKKILNKDFPFSKKIILEDGISKEFGEGNSKVLIEKVSNRETIYNVETENSGYLFISELYYPGWQVYIDGNVSEIKKANYAFRAVFIPPGSHQVVFKYEPRSLYQGTIISLVLLIVLITVVFIMRPLGKKRGNRYT